MTAPSRREQNRTLGQFLLGIGLGLIPMALLFLSISWTPFCYRGCASNQQTLAQTFGTVGLILYGTAIVATIALLIIRRVRQIGYGLLIIVLITPCAAMSGCVVRIPSPYG